MLAGLCKCRFTAPASNYDPPLRWQVKVPETSTHSRRLVMCLGAVLMTVNVSFSQTGAKPVKAACRVTAPGLSSVPPLPEASWQSNTSPWRWAAHARLQIVYLTSPLLCTKPQFKNQQVSRSSWTSSDVCLFWKLAVYKTVSFFKNKKNEIFSMWGERITRLTRWWMVWK